jgi:5-methylcytosine-specific restriction endonuclease McrA
MQESKPCKGCGQTLTLDNFHQSLGNLDGKRNLCKSCTKTKDAQRYQANQEQQKQRALAYYHANSKEQLAKSKLKRDSNPKAYSELRRKRRLANIDAYRRVEYSQRLKHRDRRLSQQRARSKVTIELNLIKNNRRRSRLAAAISYRVSTKEIVKLKNSPCFACGSTGKKDIDHIIPLSRSGTNGIGNYMPLCDSCNASKYNKTFMEWRVYRMKIGNPLPMDVKNV